MKDEEREMLFRDLEKQIIFIMGALRKSPDNKRQILVGYASNFFDAVKETIKKQGIMSPFFIIMGDQPVFGVPPITDDVLAQAKASNAEAVVLIEGFQSERDISDIVYHVSMSATCMGVVGWVLKVKLGDGMVEFVREMPYFFDTKERVKSLGELISEMERE